MTRPGPPFAIMDVDRSDTMETRVFDGSGQIWIMVTGPFSAKAQGHKLISDFVTRSQISVGTFSEMHKIQIVTRRWQPIAGHFIELSFVSDSGLAPYWKIDLPGEALIGSLFRSVEAALESVPRYIKHVISNNPLEALNAQ